MKHVVSRKPSAEPPEAGAGAPVRVGVDVGGTKVLAVVLDPRGTIVGQARRPTGHGPDAVVESIVAAAVAALEHAGTPLAAVASLGVGMPGAVDAATGVVRDAVNLGITALDLRAVLTERLGAPTYVENDVNAAAVAAYDAFGGGCRCVAYLNLGTGLAAGFVLDGALWRGATGVAGEIGHLVVDPAGAPCACGLRGCLETVASGLAIARSWPVAGDHPAALMLAAAARGDAAAAAAARSFASGVLAAARLVVLTVDAELVLLGGGLANLGAPLLQLLTQLDAQESAASPFAASLALSARIRLVPPDYPVAALGAARLGGSDAAPPLGSAAAPDQAGERGWARV
ncbi:MULTISPECIES: ROK family protein [unclassified Actinotalea]|uniref:ROK family protein n=1 Tax=unclassified Actinotalea TaxID=2638618 RepID=UPI0015F53F20|nr:MULTISPECIES: ROK family protein [unclassified Actinotalea]